MSAFVYTWFNGISLEVAKKNTSGMEKTAVSLFQMV